MTGFLGPLTRRVDRRNHEWRQVMSHFCRPCTAGSASWTRIVSCRKSLFSLCHLTRLGPEAPPWPTVPPQAVLETTSIWLHSICSASQLIFYRPFHFGCSQLNEHYSSFASLPRSSPSCASASMARNSIGTSGIRPHHRPARRSSPAYPGQVSGRHVYTLAAPSRLYSSVAVPGFIGNVCSGC